MPRDAGDFALIDRVVIDAVNSAPEPQSLFTWIAELAGFRQTGIICERAARAVGVPKYNLCGWPGWP